ncbi:outer membrane lipid asymmetry maintenance protein MlaD [Pseudooceanicola sediminis]|uniref:Outer membrane lipid asymmetry maintenance protein MlaD n=1 Tax=Pseudooceanicola sediminis TaxID=2211117 RepID=A0A399IXA1_9RHOB|nr:outer membrane lipid asymmetry maintenance protein MlaD [Pseudooceanicola sediminis]KAA2313137.1 outer membrane lipid asymmetry maintenance protein MlaD [Puniceibacterium sp. HSS470]RII37785.1 outer membrane lipid asymmetry maintenance protein MlaD [Pseudooceanicola sediminis]|tara:strand:+ start:83740 stop:84198 length:459 start_codon:yes stop_codon:yes gene_type:complete
MSENTTEVVVGAGVLAIAAAFLIYAAQMSGIGSGTGGYPLFASFRSAEGVNVGTDVRLAGVKVGTVTGISLDPTTFRARTDFTLRDGIDVPDDSQAIISSEGLLGGNYVEIMPGGSTFNYAAGDEILDTQGSVSLITLLLKFVAGSGDSSSQ